MKKIKPLLLGIGVVIGLTPALLKANSVTIRPIGKISNNSTKLAKVKKGNYAHKPILKAVNYKLKLERYKKICRKGNPFGCIGVGWFANLGRGMTKNYKVAAIMFTLSCRSGNAEGCASLGDMYFQGKGVRQNLQRALVLLKYGCKNGYTPGCKIYKRAKQIAYRSGNSKLN